jgi:hypothetical protein
MFDYVRYIAPCKQCGRTLTDFQTKDTACFMEQVDLDKCHRFYTSCDGCGAWNEYQVTTQVVKIELVPEHEWEREKTRFADIVQGIGYDPPKVRM